jgi:hypothetical protein
VVCAARPCERHSILGATAGRFARVVAAVVVAAAAIPMAAGLTAALLLTAAGLTAATIAVAAVMAATLFAAAVVAGIVATAARSSSAGRLSAAARSGRSRASRSSTSRLAARLLAARLPAAMTGVQPIAQALPAALLLAARRSGIATAATSLNLRGGEQQQAQRQRQTTNSALHGRNSSQTSNTTEGKTLGPDGDATCLGAAVAFRDWRPGLFPGYEGSSGSAGKC